jgi:hypothetical protein
MPTQRHQPRPARSPAGRSAGGAPGRSRRPDGPTPGPFDLGETSERLTLIEFTWNHDGRIQPVLLVSRELLD